MKPSKGLIPFLIIALSAFLGWAATASNSAFISLPSLNSPVDYGLMDQGKVHLFTARSEGKSADTVFSLLRGFASKRIFGSASGALSPLGDADLLLLKSVFKVDQPLSEFADPRFKKAPIQKQLFSPIRFTQCSDSQCSAEQEVRALGLTLNVSYKNHYRFLEIQNAAELHALGLNGAVLQNTTEFPKYALIQAGTDWTKCFEDTVSVTFFERHPQSDQATLVHSYQILSLTFFGSLPKTASIIQVTIRDQIRGFIERVNALKPI